MVRRLRVLLDATSIPPARGGVGRYIDMLVPALSRLDINLAIACQRHDMDTFANIAPSAAILPSPHLIEHPAARLLWEQTGLVELIRRVRPDVVHDPHYTMPAVAACPRVVTLHDATFFSSPELHGRIKGPFFREAIRRAVTHADAIVTPSRATANEVSAWAGTPRGSVHVAYHGVDSSTFRPASTDEQARVRRTLDIGDADYVAFLGTIEPRKNVPALIDGWVRAVATRPHPPALVLAGAAGWDSAVDSAIAAVPEHLTIRRLGYLPLDDLSGFLSGATLVTYPSLGEGFGLPVLEAMACGAAVLTTRRLSLPEVGGDTVQYCETDAGAISEGITQLLDNPTHRTILAQAGLARSHQFTWENAAKVHVAAYRAASKGH